MTKMTRSAILICDDDEATQRLLGSLANMPGMSVEAVPGKLSTMNGTSVELAKGRDLVMFRADASETDLKTVEQIRKAVGANVSIVALLGEEAALADVRRLTRAGVDDVLPDTITPEELVEQIGATLTARSAPVEIAARAPARPGKVIAVTQSRGGIGSTTVAVNLADALQERPARFGKPKAVNSVVIVDLDIQFGAVASFLDVNPSDALYEMSSSGQEPDETFLETCLTRLSTGLSVLAAPAHFAPLDSLKPNQVSRLLELLRLRFDYVVVDLPRALVDWLAPVLSHTDRMLMVTDSTVPSIRQARRLIDFYTEDNLNLQIEIVINHEARPLVMRRHHSEAAKILERPFQHWLPEDPSPAREALDRGVPIASVAKRSKLSKAIQRLSSATAMALTKQNTTYTQPRPRGDA